MLAPEQNWWKPMGRMEKTWLTVAFVWCVFLTIMMPLWYYYGKQNVPTETYRTTSTEFSAKVNAFVEKCKVGEETVNGVPLPVVEACDGNDIYHSAVGERAGISIAYLFHGFESRLFTSTCEHQFAGFAWL
jgi:cytochrome c oxidase subunit 2